MHNFKIKLKLLKFIKFQIFFFFSQFESIFTTPLRDTDPVRPLYGIVVQKVAIDYPHTLPKSRLS